MTLSTTRCRSGRSGRTPRWIFPALVGLAAVVPGRSEAHLSMIRQGRESAGARETGDLTGHAVACGDFNGDGFDDLAMGAPHEDVSGLSQAGAVVISYGSKHGITHEGASILTADNLGRVSQTHARFGWSVLSADFNEDGIDDLVIGAPGANVDGAADQGQIYVLAGDASGPFVVRECTQADADGTWEGGDEFGYALTAGDFDHDGHADLAVGSPGEDSDAGAIFYFQGNSPFFLLGLHGWYKQTQLGGTSAAGDRFGTALAAGDVLGSDHDELVIGAPHKTSAGQADAGAVYVVPGADSGFSPASARIYDASDFDFAQTGAYFGRALAIGALCSGTHLSLAIGEPYRDHSGKMGAGRVLVVPGSQSGLDFARKLILTENAAGGTVQSDDYFGYALAASRWWDADGYDDLAIGAPGDGLGVTQYAGQVQILNGGFNGPDGSYGWSGFNQGTMNEPSEYLDRLGSSIAFGAFDETGRGSVAVGAPGEDQETGMVHVIAPWRQAFGLSCRASIAMDCADQPVFSVRPFDPVWLASITKTMTVLIAAERTQLPPSDSRYVDPNTEYVVPAWVANNVGGSQVPLSQGETMTLVDLMFTCMMLSGNDAAYAIGDLLHGSEGPDVTAPLFAAEMNARALALGMDDTYFTNPAGLDDEPVGPELGEPKSTPWDMMKLSRAAMDNPLVAQIVGTINYPMVRRWADGTTSNWTAMNIFGGVLQNSIQPATGIKGGGTTNAQATGLFAADAFLGGNVVAGTFYTPFAVSDQTYVPDAAKLLTLALSPCWPDLTLFPDAEWRPSVYPPVPLEVSSESGAFAEFSDYGLASGDYDRQIELFGHGLEGRGAGRLTFTRISEVVLGAGGASPHGIGPFESHEDIVITNLGTSPAWIRVDRSISTFPTELEIPPRQSAKVPAFEGEARLDDFRMTIKNADAFGLPAHLSIEESYGFRAEIAETPGDWPVFTARLRRGATVNDQLGFSIELEEGDLGDGAQVVMMVDLPSLSTEVPDGEVGGVQPMLRVLPPFPNPFRDRVEIGFSLPGAARVGARILDAQGRRVRELTERDLAPGKWNLEWDGLREDGAAAPAGVYFFQVTRDGKSEGEGRLIRVR